MKRIRCQELLGTWSRSRVDWESVDVLSVRKNHDDLDWVKAQQKRQRHRSTLMVFCDDPGIEAPSYSIRDSDLEGKPHSLALRMHDVNVLVNSEMGLGRTMATDAQTKATES